MRIASRCFAAALPATAILAIWGAEAQETVAKGIFHGHGIVKAVARPGDIIDFTIDAAKYTILEVKVVAHAK